MTTTNTTTAATVSNLSALPDVGATTKAPSSKMGKNEFLKLLTVQLKNQDPLSPVDNTQMVAQLAQFSQLESLQGISDKMDGISTAAAASNQLATTVLVGKQALFHADRIGLVAGRGSTFQLSLAAAADDAAAVIADPNGRVVRTLHLGAQPAGASDATWDGLDASGKALPSGEYLLSVSGTKKDGTSVAATANVRATITGVSYDDGIAKVVVAGRHLSLSDVVAISLPASGA